MFRRILPTITLALALAACDRKESPDAELTRDLQLASQQQAAPQFQDVPLSEVPDPRAKNRAPAPIPRAKSAAPARRPRPITVAASPRVRDRQPEPEEAESPAPARSRGIRTGTSFGLSTQGQVCTSNLPGDKIVAITTEPVSGEDGAYIPAGTSVVLEVTSVTPADGPGSAQISLRVRSVVLNGEPHGVEGNVAVLSELERGQVAQSGGSDKKKVIGGAIAGAVIGQVLGRDTRSTVIGAAAGAAAGTAAAAATRKYHACLPAGGSLRVTTSQPIVLGD